MFALTDRVRCVLADALPLFNEAQALAATNSDKAKVLFWLGIIEDMRNNHRTCASPCAGRAP